ncbi:MAG: hypothetical protein QOG15_745 [Solirubrobacteraceae bacterium]|jgi:FkbM family methyltransferase|nr:hypothetical protein [Solirubrobacteraceae bacterium]
MRISRRIAATLNVYRRLSRSGVRRRSIVAYPVRRRIGARRGDLRLRDGTRLTAPPGEPLLTLYHEIWIADSYRPAGWTAVTRPTVVDIGANIGVFSVWAARRLGAFRIVALEPSPVMAKELLLNLARNRIQGACVLQVAVGGGRRDAVLYRRGAEVMNTLFQGDRYGSAFTAGHTVRVITLDDVFELYDIDCCDLLKLDCEGAEYEILYGCSARTLGRIRHLVLEYHEGLDAGGPDELESFLRERGFAVTRFAPLDIEGGHMHAERMQ